MSSLTIGPIHAPSRCRDESATWKVVAMVLGVLAMGMVLQIVAAAVMLLDNEAVNVVVNQPQDVVVIVGDNWLRAYCIVGAVLGSILAIAIYPPKEVSQFQFKTAIRKAAANLTVSLISGIMFTPVIIRYFELPRDGDWVLFSAGTVSLLSVSVLSALLPILATAAKNRAKDVAAKAFGPRYIPDSDFNDPLPPDQGT